MPTGDWPYGFQIPHVCGPCCVHSTTFQPPPTAFYQSPVALIVPGPPQAPRRLKPPIRIHRKRSTR